MDEFNICVITWNSLSAFTRPPTSFFRENTMAARPLAELLGQSGEGLRVLLSLFSSILPNVTLFIWERGTGLGRTQDEGVRNRSDARFPYKERKTHKGINSICKVHLLVYISCCKNTFQLLFKKIQFKGKSSVQN